MDVPAFCRESRVLIVAGKGGVGKTTICAALGRTAAESGLSVLLVELEGKVGLARAFGDAGPLEYEETTLMDATESTGAVTARRITPDDALLEYLADHGMKRFSKRLVSSGALDVVATAIPGIRDILVLGKVKQLERSHPADLILVDAPATGHVMTFLTSSERAPRRCQVGTSPCAGGRRRRPPHRSPTMPCRPRDASRRDARERGGRGCLQLEDRVGVSLGPLIVNACLLVSPNLGGQPGEGGFGVGRHRRSRPVVRPFEGCGLHEPQGRPARGAARSTSRGAPPLRGRVPYVPGEEIGFFELGTHLRRPAFGDRGAQRPRGCGRYS